jgi:hypothetical protein
VISDRNLPAAAGWLSMVIKQSNDFHTGFSVFLNGMKTDSRGSLYPAGDNHPGSFLS